jgi:hypothetical protein
MGYYPRARATCAAAARTSRLFLAVAYGDKKMPQTQ